MKIKTWKIGECCRGGIITVKVDSKTVSIYGKDWPVGASKRTCARNAHIFIERHFNFSVPGWESEADYFLDWLTSYYYADTIMEWIKK